MNDFDPGEGWREVSRLEVHGAIRHVVEYDDHGLIERQWLPEGSVPPLPTADATLISVQPELDWWVLDTGTWSMVHGVERLGPDALRQRITGFEVLAEPPMLAADSLRIAEARLVAVEAVCAQRKPWDERNADSAEARSAIAYNHALVKVRAAMRGGS